MPALAPTDHFGTITWLGLVAQDIPEGRVNSDPVRSLELDFGGPVGDVHHGETRKSCVRVKSQHEVGTVIRNTRQISIVSAEEMEAIAAEIGIEALNPAWLGATIVVDGIPDFSHIPPSSRLQAASGTTLIVDMQNRPCIWPAKELERDHEGYGKKFKPAAEGRRGVTASVERPGSLALGDKLCLHVPEQRGWRP